MSKQAIEDFRKQINESTELQAKVRGLNVDGLVALASEHGKVIEKDELRAFLAEMGAKQMELSDFELELVAGGSMGPASNPDDDDC